MLQEPNQQHHPADHQPVPSAAPADAAAQQPVDKRPTRSRIEWITAEYDKCFGGANLALQLEGDVLDLEQKYARSQLGRATWTRNDNIQLRLLKRLLDQAMTKPVGKLRRDQRRIAQ